MMMADIRITVLKRTFNQDAAEQYGPGFRGPCEMLEDGQVFIVEADAVVVEDGCLREVRLGDLLQGRRDGGIGCESRSKRG